MEAKRKQLLEREELQRKERKKLKGCVQKLQEKVRILERDREKIRLGQVIEAKKRSVIDQKSNEVKIKVGKKGKKGEEKNIIIKEVKVKKRKKKKIVKKVLKAIEVKTEVEDICRFKKNDGGKRNNASEVTKRK